MGDNLSNKDLENVNELNTNFFSIPSNKNQANFIMGGTAPYMAPEYLARIKKNLQKKDINHIKAKNAVWNLESNTTFMKKLKSKNSKAWNLYRNTVKRAGATLSVKAQDLYQNVLNEQYPAFMRKGCKTRKVQGKLTQLTSTSYRIVFD